MVINIVDLKQAMEVSCQSALCGLGLDFGQQLTCCHCRRPGFNENMVSSLLVAATRSTSSRKLKLLVATLL